EGTVARREKARRDRALGARELPEAAEGNRAQPAHAAAPHAGPARRAGVVWAAQPAALRNTGPASRATRGAAPPGRARRPHTPTRHPRRTAGASLAIPSALAAPLTHGTYFRSPQGHDVRALEPHGEAVR